MQQEGRFYGAPPLERLDDLGAMSATGADLLPECNVILAAAAAAAEGGGITLDDILRCLKDAESATWTSAKSSAIDSGDHGGGGDSRITPWEDWYAQCNEDFTQSAKKKTKLSWEEFAGMPAGRAVLSYALYDALGEGEAEAEEQ